MTEPTKISLDEAAKLAGVADWEGIDGLTHKDTLLYRSAYAHALTLDQLHGRKHPVDLLLIEARILATVQRPYSVHATCVIAGERDGTEVVQVALAALKRGMELAAPVPVDDAWVSYELASAGLRTSAPKIQAILRNAGFIITTTPQGTE